MWFATHVHTRPHRVFVLDLLSEGLRHEVVDFFRQHLQQDTNLTFVGKGILELLGEGPLVVVPLADLAFDLG